MSNHTPGPWQVSADGYDVKTVSGAGFCTLYAVNSVGVCGLYADDIEAVNARLIAAAPELLDFAEVAGGFITWAKDNGADPAAMDGLEKMRRAAIAKANGE